MPNNVIELVVQLKDRVTGPLQGVQGSLGKLKAAAFGVAGLAAAAKVLKDVVDNTVESQNALAQLDVAFSNSAESARRSRSQILAFSDATLGSTTFADEAVTKAQTALLRFGRVSGETFSRAREDILDVSAALGVDLETAAFSVGRALESPAQGLRQLRSLGVTFGDDQQKLIQRLSDTGRTAEAQTIILEALEQRFKGAAAAARGTLGGAIAALKNNFGELFETTQQGANTAADAVNKITEVISDPQFKENLQAITGELLDWARAFLNVVSTSIRGLRELANFAQGIQGSLAPKTGIDAKFDEQNNLGASLNRAMEAAEKARAQGDRVAAANAEVLIARIRARLTDLQRDIRQTQQGFEAGENRPGGGRSRGSSGLAFISNAEVGQQRSDANDRAMASLEELRVTAQKVQEDYRGVALASREIEESTRTAAENAGAAWERYQARVADSVREGLISVEQGNARLKEQLDEVLKPIDVNEITRLRLVEPLTEAQQRVKAFVQGFKDAFQDLIETGSFSFKNFVRLLIAELSKREIFKAIDAIGAALSKALSSSGSSGGKSGFIAGVAQVLGGFFGGRAGGGDFAGLTKVGEDGPEWVAGRGRVYNQRQMAFAGGAAAVNYAPVTNVTISGGNADADQLALAFEARIQQNNARQREEVIRMLDRNGFGRMR